MTSDEAAYRQLVCFRELNTGCMRPTYVRAARQKAELCHAPTRTEDVHLVVREYFGCQATQVPERIRRLHEAQSPSYCRCGS